ncbi:MAG: Fe-S protein assembly co-chaperone HscB [Gammaproteobacteria bacterium]
MRPSYFAVLDLEPRFALALDRLEQAYRALASRVHPDRYATGTPGEQRQALTLAADANEAYRTLRKPAPRARHLLSLRGVELGDQSNTVTPAFLLEQMEWREALAEARAARDARALNDLRSSVRARAALLHARLEALLDVDLDNLAAARCVQELMFIEKLDADIDEAQALLEG